MQTRYLDYRWVSACVSLHCNTVIRSTFILVILSALFTACGNQPEYDIQAPSNKYILCRGSALYLNEGKKWKANIETTKGIDGMLTLVNQFDLPADTAAYHNLGDSLIQDYIYIVNYCDYMGEAHELIHAYLFPLQELIVPLQIGGQTTCDAQYPKIKEHLEKYHEYFE